MKCFILPSFAFSFRKMSRHFIVRRMVPEFKLFVVQKGEQTLLSMLLKIESDKFPSVIQNQSESMDLKQNGHIQHFCYTPKQSQHYPSLKSAPNMHNHLSSTTSNQCELKRTVLINYSLKSNFNYILLNHFFSHDTFFIRIISSHANKFYISTNRILCQPHLERSFILLTHIHSFRRSSCFDPTHIL